MVLFLEEKVPRRTALIDQKLCSVDLILPSAFVLIGMFLNSIFEYFAHVGILYWHVCMLLAWLSIVLFNKFGASQI